MLPISASSQNCGVTFVSAITLGMVLFNKTFLLCSVMFGIGNMVAIIAMIVTKTKAQTIGKDLYPDALSSILAARAIIIKSAALLGTGSCLVISNYLSLRLTLWSFLIPLVAGFLPFAWGQKLVVDVNSFNEVQ